VSRNPIKIAVIVVALLWGGAAALQSGGRSGGASAAADSLSRDGRAGAEDSIAVVRGGRAAAPSEVLVPRQDWPLRGVERPDVDRRGVLRQAGLDYGGAGGVFVWRWTPPDGAAAGQPVLLELMVYEAADYERLRASGKAAPVLVRGRRIVVAYHQPRDNPFASADPRHAMRESLRLTRLDLVDFAAKVRDRLQRRDSTLRIAVED
jgi:hypothetical protein